MKSKSSALVPSKMPSTRLPQLKGSDVLPAPYTTVQAGVARTESKKKISDEQRRLSELPKKVEDSIAVKRAAKKEPKTSLADWFNLPRTDLTPELKRDLQLINMRSVLDPKRMYRKQGKFKVPEYSQVGVIVEGPTEFYNGRIEHRQRKETFVEEVLAGETETGRFRSKFEDLQLSKKSGKHAYYKALQTKRRKSRKGG